MFKKILAVDDSDLLHKIYDLVLTRYARQGTQVLHAMNGREALNRIAEHADVDLILLDINMPVMSGLEFLRHRRSFACFENVPVIVISTEGKAADTSLALEEGAVGYVTKPFQPNELHAIIERIVTGAPDGVERLSR